MREARMIVSLPLSVPLKMHLQVTTRCNLGCEKCFYRGDGELAPQQVVFLIEEWAAAGVKAIAIGGGEPMLVPWLGDLVDFARSKGLFVAVTTNGTILRGDVRPDRVAVSWDRLHPTWGASGNAEKFSRALAHFEGLGCRVAVNHVVTDAKAMELVSGNCKEVVFILEKPAAEFSDWGTVKGKLRQYAVDACLAKVVFGRHCYQGEISMYLDSGMNAAVCSNIKNRVPYRGLERAWASLPKECLYQGGAK